MANQTRNPTSDYLVGGNWSGILGSRYNLVDDYPDTADYLTASATYSGDGHISNNTAYIVFGFSAFSIPSNAKNIAVYVDYYDRDSTSGANQMTGRLRVGGNYYDHATPHDPSTTMTQRSDAWATNPKTGAAWTVDDINGSGANPLQGFGVYLSDVSPSIRLASIRVRVEYSTDISVTVSPLALALSLKNVAMGKGRILTVEALALALGWQEILLALPGLIHVEPLALTALGQAVGMRYFHVQVSPLALTLSLKNLALTRSYKVAPLALTLAMQNVGMTYTQVAAEVTPRDRPEWSALPIGTDESIPFDFDFRDFQDTYGLPISVRSCALTVEETGEDVSGLLAGTASITGTVARSQRVTGAAKGTRYRLTVTANFAGGNAFSAYILLDAEL